MATPEEVNRLIEAPANEADTLFLLLIRHPQPGGFRGAVLPCYRIYREVGKAPLEHGSPNPLYRRWIDTYSGEEFGSLVEAVLDLTDEVCEGLSPSQKVRIGEAFFVSSRYEWMLWDAAWNLEGWPTG
jgi:thiaminase (transcriptional activator TenA)